MIYRTFALAFIFALAFASEEGVAVDEEKFYDAVGEEPAVNEGMWNRCKGAACKTFDRLRGIVKESVRNTDAIHNENMKQGETIRLVRELVNRIKQLLSESQAPKSCPASTEVAAEEFNTQLGKLTEKYLDPLMKKMDEAMEKLPTEVKDLFKTIMADFKHQIATLEKPMQELTQADLQKLLTGLKERYEDKVKETMEEVNKGLDADAPQNKEIVEQKENLEKLQNLMKNFEGKSQAEAMKMVVDPMFVKGVQEVLGQDAMNDGLKKLTEAIGDIANFASTAECAAKLGVFQEYEL